MFIPLATEIKVFIKKSFYFALPFLLAIAILEFFGLYSGELCTIDRVVEIQQNSIDDILYARGKISQNQAKYKHLSILNKKPEILAIGASRVMQLNQAMFGEEDYYNGGGIVVGAEDLADFFDVLPDDYSPRVLIVDLDYFWFTDTYVPRAKMVDEISLRDEALSPAPHIFVFRYLIGKIITEPSILPKIISRREDFSGKRTLGFAALSGDGFPKDGSRQRGREITEFRENPVYIDREGIPIIKRVTEGLPQFNFDSKLSQERFLLLEEFLNEARERNVEVLAFTPPFSSEVYQILDTSENYVETFHPIHNKLHEVFKSHDYIFIDYSDLRKVGLSDLYMVDGYHPSETAMAYIFRDMLKDNRVQALFGDPQLLIEGLDALISHPETTPFELGGIR